MPILSKPASAARTAMIYITVGALLDVWMGIWYAYLSNHPPQSDGTWYWCYGFMLTGLTLIVLGLTIGQIGRQARHAELPPPEVTGVESQVEQNAASRAPMVAPVNPAAAAVAPSPVNGAPQAGRPATPPAAPTAAVARPVTSSRTP